MDHSPLSLSWSPHKQAHWDPCSTQINRRIPTSGPCLLLGYSSFAGSSMAKEMDRTRGEEGANFEAVCWQQAPLFPWETAQSGLAW